MPRHEGLQARHRRVLELLGEGWTYAAIARVFNVSTERIRRVEREAHALTWDYGPNEITSPADYWYRRDWETMETQWYDDAMREWVAVPAGRWPHGGGYFCGSNYCDDPVCEGEHAERL